MHTNTHCRKKSTNSSQSSRFRIQTLKRNTSAIYLIGRAVNLFASDHPFLRGQAPSLGRSPDWHSLLRSSEEYGTPGKQLFGIAVNSQNIAGC